jgi:epoxyqueuosine reductase
MATLATQDVVDLCTSHGFAIAGVSSANRSVHEVAFLQWLQDEKYGEMEWMHRNVDVRLDPRNLVEGAKSVICVADRYGKLEGEVIGEREGQIARYARGCDYHKTMKKRLHIVCDALREQSSEDVFRGCVDTVPILEREFAQHAGIGAVGKHTLLIEQGIGSWLFLGAIVTTAAIEPSEENQSDPCATCTRCIDACPTDAITPWEVDARKCISYLTIEHRGDIAPELYPKIGQWIFGCDICQEVCPHNQPNEMSDSAAIHESYTPRMDSLDVLDVLGWDENARREHFRGSAMKRAKLEMIRRNAVIVAGNILTLHEDEILLSKLKSIAKDCSEHALVRSAAQDVLLQLEEIK